MRKMDSMKDINVVLEEIWKSAPVELKTAAPGILGNVTDIATTVTLYFSELKPLKSIAQHLAEGVHASPEMANICLENCSNNTFVEQNRDALFLGMTSKEACSDAVRKGMEEIMASYANKILIMGAVMGGFCALIEGYKAYMFWQLIKDAKNLVEKSPGQRIRISKQLENIIPLVKSLDKAIADFKRKDIARDDFNCAKEAAEYFINEIRINVGEFLKEINELHVNINGMVMELRIKRTNAMTSAISGTVSCVASITNATILAPFANPYLIVGTRVLAVVQGLIAGTNICLHIISKEQLDQLQGEIEKIEEIRNEGLQIQSDVNKKSREIIGKNSKFDFSRYK